METMYDVVIIGSGPAGYTAAIYTSRAFLKTLVIAGPTLGGQLTTTTEVENFPGFPKGILGTQLLTDMKTQAERFGTEVGMYTVLSIRQDVGKKHFIVTTDKTEIQARTVIVATGASAKPLGVATEELFRGKGISYCATCDGFFFRGKDIAVLGGGDTAMEEATFLTTFASHVTIIHRRDEFRASPIMLEKAKKNPKISFLVNKVVDSFYGDMVLKGMKLIDTKTNKAEDFPVSGAFVAIGHTPATGFLKGFVGLDEKGYVGVRGMRASTEPHTETSVPGIFAAGDCVDSRYRQGIVAAGMGAMAALDAQKYLEDMK
jgi:thioredoxin reductase (NADPH)